MRNILFDLDGTLIHSLPGIEETIQATLKSLQKPTSNGQTFRPLVGYPLESVFTQLLGENDPDVELAVATYRNLYMELGLPMARPYEGIPELLETLYSEGRSLFVVTARNEEVAKMILHNHAMDPFLKSVRGERQGDGRDTKADLVAEVMLDQGLTAAETVMVGDRRFDTEAALLNGCSAVGVTYGYGSAEELIDAGTPVLAANPEELGAVLL
jgi:phosphoglycolate phosphatase